MRLARNLQGIMISLATALSACSSPIKSNSDNWNYLRQISSVNRMDGMYFLGKERTYIIDKNSKQFLYSVEETFRGNNPVVRSGSDCHIPIVTPKNVDGRMLDGIMEAVDIDSDGIITPIEMDSYYKQITKYFCAKTTDKK